MRSGSCGIDGDGAAIQSCLATNCDNHPLVIDILGGLINNYLPARGNFDAWAADPDGGAKLELSLADIYNGFAFALREAARKWDSVERRLSPEARP